MEPELARRLLQPNPDGQPWIFTVNRQIAYASVSTEEGVIAVGPVRFHPDTRLRSNLQLAALSPAALAGIPFCAFSDFIRELLLLHNLFHDELLAADALMDASLEDAQIEVDISRHFSGLMFENQEREQTHNPYDQEVREFLSIEQGDVGLLKRIWAEKHDGVVGVVARDELRNMKNLAIIVTTFASRAAIRGGVHPEIAYSLNDAYLSKIEELSDIQAIRRMVRKFEIHFAMLVGEIRERKNGAGRLQPNPRVEQCKDYIYKRLHSRIVIREMAQALRLNANYLADLFRECEGMTLSAFILQEKTESAKNLLIHSQNPLSEIAAHLGFSSQSYFGRQFRKQTGMTPQKYRETHAARDLRG